jgi:ribosomal protein S18 acetylase RimI-like enzyme
VRLLEQADAQAFQALRLQGLREAPAAFASSWQEEQGELLAAVAARLAAHDNGFVLGAFDGETLVGVTGVQRESMRKLAHKAFVWGVYVAPTARRRGMARALLSAALSFAATRLGVRQLLLGVNARNAPAIALYHELGFEDCGVEPDFLQVDGVFDDEIHMICRLLPATP